MNGVEKKELYFLVTTPYDKAMIELLPAMRQDEPKVTDLQEFTDISNLSDQAASLIDYAIRKGPRAGFSRQTVKESFESAFQLIGGVPRLALWADKNPTQFYNLYAKLLPTATTLEVGPPSCSKDLEILTSSQLKQLVLQHAVG
jgi:hypothetical protein